MAGKYHPRSFHKNIRDKHSGNTAEQIKSRKYRIPPLIRAESGTLQDIQVPEYSSCRCLVLFQSLGFLYSLNIFSIVRKDLNHTEMCIRDSFYCNLSLQTFYNRLLL